MLCRGGSCSVAADLLCVLWLLWVVLLEVHWHQRPSLLLALGATKMVYWPRQKGNAASHQLSSGLNNELCLLSSLSSYCGVSFSWISCRICTRIEALKAGPQCLCSNVSYPREEIAHVHKCVCMLFLMHPCQPSWCWDGLHLYQIIQFYCTSGMVSTKSYMFFL